MGCEGGIFNNQVSKTENGIVLSMHASPRCPELNKTRACYTKVNKPLLLPLRSMAIVDTKETAQKSKSMSGPNSISISGIPMLSMASEASIASMVSAASMTPRSYPR